MKELIKKKSHQFLKKQLLEKTRNFKNIFFIDVDNSEARKVLSEINALEITSTHLILKDESVFITEVLENLNFLKDKISSSSRIIIYQQDCLKDIKKICQDFEYEILEEKSNVFGISFYVLRPVVKLKPEDHFLSIIVPCRNEKGNIEKLIVEMPKLDVPFEIIFVEGHSLDNTWEEILRVKKIYGDKFEINCLQQTGSGKANAVEEGIAISKGCLITILDADLTVHPTDLVKFIDLFMSGEADFVNGCRLTLPMEKGAMRSLNKFGNWFFAQFLSFVLRVKITDSLCGTKLFRKKDYDRFKIWREDFGNYDPFGDFNLLFPASVLKLGIKNLPVQYRARVYGSTNISRFYHGWLLFKMGVIGLFKIRLKIFLNLVMLIPENFQNYL
jgi:glycosyltransferase involved in cell wall biosynthesis